MVERWLIDERIDHEPVIFLSGSTQADECEFLFVNYDGIEFKVIFPPTVDAIEIKYLEVSALAEDSVAELVRRAQCDGPLNAFFIQPSPEQIVEPRALSINDFFGKAYYDENPKKSGRLMQYIMIANGTWINVFSYDPPKVEILDSESSGSDT